MAEKAGKKPPKEAETNKQNTTQQKTARQQDQSHRTRGRPEPHAEAQSPPPSDLASACAAVVAAAAATAAAAAATAKAAATSAEPAAAAAANSPLREENPAELCRRRATSTPAATGIVVHEALWVEEFSRSPHVV